MIGDIVLASLISMEYGTCGRRLDGFAGDETGLRFDLLTTTATIATATTTTTASTLYIYKVEMKLKIIFLNKEAILLAPACRLSCPYLTW